jgi:hypothetical protein
LYFLLKLKAFLGVKYNNTKNLKFVKHEKVFVHFDIDYELVNFKRAVVPADTTLLGK